MLSFIRNILYIIIFFFIISSTILKAKCFVCLCIGFCFIEFFYEVNLQKKTHINQIKITKNNSHYFLAIEFFDILNITLL